MSRSQLDYASVIWNPYKEKYNEQIEKVQRRATKTLPNLKHLSYVERLKKLKLPCLKYRRIRGDLIEVYKIITGSLDWHQCGNSLALCYFAVVMELPDSLWMNCKSEFGVIFLRCSPT